MEEKYYSTYDMHPRSTKMYKTMKENYWWKGMKNDIVEFISKCLIYQQVKAEHKYPIGLLQSLSIFEWKWEHITIDFMVGLPKTQQGQNVIWVIMNRLTKSEHFLPVKTNYNLNKLAELYMNEIVRFHRALVSIVLNRDPRFTSRF